MMMPRWSISVFLLILLAEPGCPALSRATGAPDPSPAGPRIVQPAEPASALRLFTPRMQHVFITEYRDMFQAEEIRPVLDRNALYDRIVKNSQEQWFPTLNSYEYDPDYVFRPPSVGEQILYSMGMVLLQVTANELDRTINRDN